MARAIRGYREMIGGPSVSMDGLDPPLAPNTSHPQLPTIDVILPPIRYSREHLAVSGRKSEAQPK